MNTNIKSIGFKISDEDKALLDKKLARLAFAEQYLHDLDLTFTKPEGVSSIKAAASLHFSWGPLKQIEVESYEFGSAVDDLMDKLERTARKEKEKKIQR